MSWSTEDEKYFIRALGTHSTHCKNIPRADLLRGYIASLACRAAWHNLSSTLVREFAEGELAVELAGVEAATTWQELPAYVSAV